MKAIQIDHYGGPEVITRRELPVPVPGPGEVLTRPRLADHLTDAATIRRRADDIFAALLDGALSIGVAGRYTLDDVGLAHEALESRQTVSKPLLTLAGYGIYTSCAGYFFTPPWDQGGDGGGFVPGGETR